MTKAKQKRAMNETEASIMRGLEEAVAFAKGDRSRAKVHVIDVPVPDVRAIRTKLDLSQDKFAVMFGVSAGTVRGWEQGRRRPDGPARVLLTVIDREPDAVKRALSDLATS